LDAGGDFGGHWLYHGADVFWRRRCPADSAIQALPHGFWSSFGYTTHDKMAALPNTFLTTTLASNFGTFLLYMLSCLTCIVCYHKHPKFNLVRHLLIPVFGLVANLACMAFYVVGPFMGYGTKDGAAISSRCSFDLGHLWRNLLPPCQQDFRAHDRVGDRIPAA
jgi:hypothetical protein